MMPRVRWLDRLAHDLRGPLTPLQTAAYLLRSGQVVGERQQELFVLIERQTRQLVRMIDELGDWSRISQERFLGLREPCEPAVLIDYARGSSGIAGAAAVIENHAEGVIVEGDPVRLTQMLRGLIEYAAGRGDLPARVVFSVSGDRLQIDVSGAGATPDAADLMVLLDEPQPAPVDDGLGLRLLIARAIAEAHGGALTAHDDSGALLLRCELPLRTDADQGETRLPGLR